MLALNAIESGREHLGVGALTEKLRWDSPTKCPSDNFRAFYARMFACAHPEHKDLFQYKPSAADYINYPPLLGLIGPPYMGHDSGASWVEGVHVEGDCLQVRADMALGWEDPQLSLQLENV